ncbi:MAG TPA: hypothetical protein PKN33_19475 [Phycisphaerae bacterium]|nr:hypothetical protein [Phycisphaerae bacterium]
MVRGKAPVSTQRDAERQIEYKDLKWTDATLVQQDGNAVVMEMRLPGEDQMAIRMKGQVVDGPGANQHPIQQFGLNSGRALGDNNIALYDATGFNAIASFTNNFCADDMISIPFGTEGQAFVIEEFELVTLLIALNPGVDTWAEVRFYDLDEQVVNDCTNVSDDVPIEGAIYGRVVANLGRDAASPSCNLSIAGSAHRRVNLLTGIVTGYGDAAERVIDSNGVKVNTVGAGAFNNMGRGIPFGPGDLSSGSSATGLALRNLQHQTLVSVRLGVANGTNDGIVPAPVDACSTALGVSIPGGWLTFGNDTAINFGNAFLWGDFDSQNGEFNCNEGFIFTSTINSVSMNFSARGSRDTDCDTNGIVDDIQLDISPNDDDGTLCSAAVAANGIIDACECLDCNLNGFFDVEEIAAGTALDCNSDNIPDDCQLEDNDCNNNGIPDDCDIDFGPDTDCNNNGIPDLCDLDPSDPDGNGFLSIDCDGNSVIDICERTVRDCNANGEDDFCDILFNQANDFDLNGIPDACAGLHVVMDFEDDGDVDSDYVLGPVHDQPFDGDDTPTPDPTGVVNADWATIDFDAAAFTGEAGVADVTAGNIGTCGGAKTLVFTEDFARSLGYQSPAIPFSSPDVGTVVNFTPSIHSISFDIAFSDNNYQVDWDFFFDNIFDTASNSWRAFLQFETRSDGSREINLFHGTATEHTGVDWFTGAGVSHNVKLEIDYLATNYSLTNAGTLYWDGAPIATFSPRVQGAGAFPFMHRFTLQNDANTSGLGSPSGGTVTMDCITYDSSEEQVPCSSYKLADGSTDVDCDLDGVCDSLQIAGNPSEDLNTNGQLDHCEGYCIDCNHNGLPDSFEILNTNGLDNNGNGVLDVCERNVHDNSFEVNEYGVGDGFTAGLIEGQQGWRAFLDADGEISTAAAPGFKTGSQFLIVQDRPGAVGPDGLIVGPRQTAIPDADIELWSWDWRTTATAADIGLVQVEILDLCLDGPAVVGTSTALNAAPYLETGNGNVGLRVRPDVTLNGTADVEMLGISAGARGYSSTSATDIQGDFQSAAGFSAGIEILNKTGRVRGYWQASQASMIFPTDPSIHSEGEHAETQSIVSIAQVGANQRTSGGDSQVLIRISDDENNGQFGTGNDAQYWFDNFTYRSFPDCDFDGLNDLLWVENTAGIPGASTLNDKNGDDIPDRCQDCDNDCTFDNIANPPLSNIARLNGADTSCLDPCEINAAAPGCTGGGTESDCNGNGIPDTCDTAFGLTDNGDPDDGYLHIGWYDSGAQCTSFEDGSNGFDCNFVRRGGNSGDADADGVPDECQITLGAADCNENGLVDVGEIAGGTAVDANANTIPDECEGDCNNNGRLDTADLQSAGGNSIDLFPTDGIPDECCPAGQGAGDLDGDGDVDASDYQLMQECGSQDPANAGDNPLTGGAPGPIGTGTGIVAGSFGGLPGYYACGCGDINGDGIIDECDMQSFQYLITGP